MLAALTHHGKREPAPSRIQSFVVIFFEYPTISGFWAIPVTFFSNYRRFLLGGTDMPLQAEALTSAFENHQRPMSKALVQNRRQFGNNVNEGAQKREIVGYSKKMTWFDEYSCSEFQSPTKKMNGRASLRLVSKPRRSLRRPKGNKLEDGLPTKTEREQARERPAASRAGVVGLTGA